MLVEGRQIHVRSVGPAGPSRSIRTRAAVLGMSVAVHGSDTKVAVLGMSNDVLGMSVAVRTSAAVLGMSVAVLGSCTSAAVLGMSVAVLGSCTSVAVLGMSVAVLGMSVAVLGMSVALFTNLDHEVRLNVIELDTRVILAENARDHVLTTSEHALDEIVVEFVVVHRHRDRDGDETRLLEADHSNFPGETPRQVQPSAHERTRA